MSIINKHLAPPKIPLYKPKRNLLKLKRSSAERPLNLHSTLYLMCTMLTDRNFKFMAKKRRRHNKNYRRDDQRKTADFHRRERLLDHLRINLNETPKEVLRYVEDNRTASRWAPSQRHIERWREGIIIRHNSETTPHPRMAAQKSFNPRMAGPEIRAAKVCRRRKERRELLFRRGGIGNGRSVNPYRRFTQDSKVRCK